MVTRNLVIEFRPSCHPPYACGALEGVTNQGESKDCPLFPSNLLPPEGFMSWGTWVMVTFVFLFRGIWLKTSYDKLSPLHGRAFGYDINWRVNLWFSRRWTMSEHSWIPLTSSAQGTLHESYGYAVCPGPMLSFDVLRSDPVPSFARYQPARGHGIRLAWILTAIPDFKINQWTQDKLHTNREASVVSYMNHNPA